MASRNGWLSTKGAILERRPRPFPDVGASYESCVIVRSRGESDLAVMRFFEGVKCGALGCRSCKEAPRIGHPR